MDSGFVCTKCGELKHELGFAWQAGLEVENVSKELEAVRQRFGDPVRICTECFLESLLNAYVFRFRETTDD